MKVVTGDFGKADADNLLIQLRDVIYSAKGRISVAEALGVIEILKFQIYEDQTYDD